MNRQKLQYGSQYAVRRGSMPAGEAPWTYHAYGMLLWPRE